MDFKCGPAGLGPVTEAVQRLEEYSQLGLKACEIAFTYGIYIHKEEDIKEIKKAAKTFNISLSIHAPYWINLNSKEKNKTQESKKRILDCCEIGEKLGAKIVVFHTGFYSETERKIALENVKNEILDMQKTIKKNKWKIKIAPEIMGKVNVIGSIDEIKYLVEETGCSFCIDFAHILARYKKIDFDEIKNKFGKYKKWHCHFSGIEYGDKGERRHTKTPEDKIRELIKNLPDKEITIINESPYPLEDSVRTLKLIN